MTLDFSRLGKPGDDAYIQSFNGRFREECLNTHWFLSLEDANDKIGAWRPDYNESRPHAAPDYRTQVEFSGVTQKFKAESSPYAWTYLGQTLKMAGCEVIFAVVQKTEQTIGFRQWDK